MTLPLRNSRTSRQFLGLGGLAADGDSAWRLRASCRLKVACKYFTLKRKLILTKRQHRAGRLPLLPWLKIEMYLSESCTYEFDIELGDLDLELIPRHAIVIKYEPGHYIPACTPSVCVNLIHEFSFATFYTTQVLPDHPHLSRRRSINTELGHRKPTGSQSKKKVRYNRNAWLPKWDERYLWARVHSGLVSCVYCVLYPAIRHNTQIARGEKKLAKITSDDLTKHENDARHGLCHAQYLKDRG